eukprot:1189668-Prorocentrum_minimum.AAC.2
MSVTASLEERGDEMGGLLEASALSIAIPPPSHVPSCTQGTVLVRDGDTVDGIAEALGIDSRYLLVRPLPRVACCPKLNDAALPIRLWRRQSAERNGQRWFGKLAASPMPIRRSERRRLVVVPQSGPWNHRKNYSRAKLPAEGRHLRGMDFAHAIRCHAQKAKRSREP